MTIQHVLAAASLISSSSSSDPPALHMVFIFCVGRNVKNHIFGQSQKYVFSSVFRLFFGFESTTDRYLTDREVERNKDPPRYFQFVFISSVLLSIVAEGKWFLQPCWLQTSETVITLSDWGDPTIV